MTIHRPSRRQILRMAAALPSAVGLVACATQSVNAASLPTGPIAPLVESDTWINTKPIVWHSLRGKVVMVEFWTFGCYNCQNVLPAMKAAYADYKSRGFTLLGVHSPEFEHEKKLSNVQAAVKKAGIEYPVALDNDFANWRRYRNRYWPALYLVDKRGVIRYTRIGEGGYQETRQWIEKLLVE